MPAIPNSYVTSESLDGLGARATNNPQAIVDADVLAAYARLTAAEIDRAAGIWYELPIAAATSPVAYNMLAAANELGVLYYTYAILQDRSGQSDGDAANPWQAQWEAALGRISERRALPDAVERGAVAIETWSQRIQGWVNQFLADHAEANPAAVNASIAALRRLVHEWVWNDGPRIPPTAIDNDDGHFAESDDILSGAFVDARAQAAANAVLRQFYTFLFGTASPDANTNVLSGHLPATSRPSTQTSGIVQHATGTFTLTTASVYTAPATAISLPSAEDAEWIGLEIHDTGGWKPLQWIDESVLLGLDAVAAGDATSANSFLLPDLARRGQTDYYVGRTSDNNLLIGASTANVGTVEVQVYRISSLGSTLAPSEVTALASAAVKAFARIGSTTPPNASDLAANPTKAQVLKVAEDGLSTLWGEDSGGLTQAQVDARVRAIDKGIKFVGSALPDAETYNAGDLAWQNGVGLFEVISSGVRANSLPAVAWTPGNLANTMLYGFDARSGNPTYGTRPDGWPASILSLFTDSANNIWLYASPGTFGTDPRDAVELTVDGITHHLPYNRTASGYDHYALGPLSQAPWGASAVQIAIHALGGLLPFTATRKDWSKVDGIGDQAVALLLAGGRSNASQIAFTQDPTNHSLIGTLKSGTITEGLPPNLQLLNRNVQDGGWRAEDNLWLTAPQSGAFTEATAKAATYTASNMPPGPRATGEHIAFRVPKILFALQPRTEDLAHLRLSTGDDGAETISASTATYLGSDDDYWFYDLRFDRPAGSELSMQWDAPTELDNIDIDANDVTGLEDAIRALTHGNAGGAVILPHSTDAPTSTTGVVEGTIRLVEHGTEQPYIIGLTTQEMAIEDRGRGAAVLDGGSKSADWSGGDGSIARNTAADGDPFIIQWSLTGFVDGGDPLYQQIDVVIRLAAVGETGNPNFYLRIRRTGATEWTDVGLLTFDGRTQQGAGGQSGQTASLSFAHQPLATRRTLASIFQYHRGFEYEFGRDALFNDLWLYRPTTGRTPVAWMRLTADVDPVYLRGNEDAIPVAKRPVNYDDIEDKPSIPAGVEKLTPASNNIDISSSVWHDAGFTLPSGYEDKLFAVNFGGEHGAVKIIAGVEIARLNAVRIGDPATTSTTTTRLACEIHSETDGTFHSYWFGRTSGNQLLVSSDNPSADAMGLDVWSLN